MLRIAAVALAIAGPVFAEAADQEKGFEFRLKDRAALVKKAGGTTGKGSSEEALASALRWLARHRDADGGWTAKFCVDRCPSDGACTGLADETIRTGLTSLVMLAYLAAGHGPDSTVTWKDPVLKEDISAGAIVREGLEFLLKTKGAPGGNHGNYELAAYTMAMAEAYGMTKTKEYGDAAQRGVEAILASQNPGLGWRYHAKSGDNDTSATAWCALALQSAEWAGLEVPAEVWTGPKAWVDRVTDADGWKSYYNVKGGGPVIVPGKNEKFADHPSMTAAALMVRVACDHDAKDPALVGRNHLLADLPSPAALKVDSYYWYWGSLAMFQLDGPGGKGWKAWFDALTKALVALQHTAKDKCLEGSWDPADDRWGFQAGRVCVTALNALSLTTYSRFRPGVGTRRKKGS